MKKTVAHLTYSISRWKIHSKRKEISFLPMGGGWWQKGVRQHKSHISSSHPENIFVYHCSVAKATPATHDITSRWLSQARQHCCLNVILILVLLCLSYSLRERQKDHWQPKTKVKKGNQIIAYIQLHVDHSYFILRSIVMNQLCFGVNS